MKKFLHHNVLVIDDVKVDCFIAESVMKRNFFAENVLCCNSAEFAITQLKTDTEGYPSLIFLDIYMPNMDGFAFLDKFTLLPDSIKSKIPIIVLSSSLRNEDMRKAQTYPCVKRWIEKPIDEVKLHALLGIGIG